MEKAQPNRLVILVTSDRGKWEYPPAPHLLQEAFKNQFDFHIVTRQLDPEPKLLKYIWDLFKNCMFARSKVIHTCGSLPGALVLLRRLWNAGPVWVHTGMDSGGRISYLINRYILQKCCDVVYRPEDAEKNFAESLANAETEIEGLSKLYEHVCRPAVAMIAPLQPGEAFQKQLQLQSRELTRQGYQIYLLVQKHHNWGSGWNHLFFWKVWNPIQSHPREEASWTWKSLIQTTWFLIFGFIQLLRFRHRFEALQAHQLYSSTTLGILARVFLKKPLVVKVITSGYAGEKRTLSLLPFFNLRLKSFSKIDQLIVLSHEMSAEMRELGFTENKLNLIPNGIETSSEPYERTFEGDIFRILYCGPFSPDKCIENILEGAQIVARKGFSIEIILVGAQNYRDAHPKLKAIAYSIRKQVSVQFVGDQKILSSFYLSADCFVLPSKSEGLSSSLLEAQSLGTPCLVSDILSHRFVVTDGVNGLIFRQGSSFDLAKKLEILVADKFSNDGGLLKKLSSESQLLIRKKFSSDYIGQQIHLLYKSLLEPKESSKRL